MILITDVKYKKVDGDVHQIHKAISEPPATICSIFEEAHPNAIEYAIETINGQKFVNSNNETIVIGMNKDTQNLIGLPFDVFQDMSQEIERLRGRILSINDQKQRAISKLEDMESMNLWQRIKHVFK